MDNKFTKKVKVGIEKKKELAGFEDVYDLIEEKIIDETLTSQKITEDRLSDNFELYQFLENEIKRLNNMNNLLTKKLDILRSSPQANILIDEQQLSLDETKAEVIYKLTASNSPMQKGLKELWGQIFN